jgi:uncharacterized protein YndB with AHSA1/START domain
VDPEHIIQWNNASEDWHTPIAENNLVADGRFLSRMEAKDGSTGFDFTGKYNKIIPLREIEYTIDYGRNVKVSFVSKGDVTIVSETFDAEQTNPAELQQAGWQSILDNFKDYVQKLLKNEKTTLPDRNSCISDGPDFTLADKTNRNAFKQIIQ